MMKEYKRDKRVMIPRDEFEEEAGEGLGQLSREEAEADLRELKARMERRVARPRMIWLPAAAAVVILLVASALVVTLLRDRPGSDSDLALAGEAVTDTAFIAMAEPLEKQGVEDSAPVVTGSTAVQAKEVKFGPLAQAIENEIAGVAVADDIIVADEQQAKEEHDYVVYAVVQEEMLEEVVVVQAVPQMRSAAMKARAETADRAAVQAAESRKDKASVDAATKKEAAVVEAAAKKEAAVVEAAAKKEAAAVEAITAGRQDAVAEPTGAAAVQGAVVPDSPASPEVGWAGYREWVTQNIRYPEGVTPVVRQEVLISFTVRSDSTLADLKAVRTPGEPFTREVFRLLGEGPRWVPARVGGNTSVTEVYVMFVFR